VGRDARPRYLRLQAKGKIRLLPLQHGQAGGALRHTLDNEPFDVGTLAPVLLERLQHQIPAWRVAHELIRPKANRMLFEPLRPDLLQVGFRDHHASGGGSRAIERQEVWPGGVEMEADRSRIDELNAFHLGVEFPRPGTLVAHEAKVHIVGGAGHPIVKLQSGPERELVEKSIGALVPRLGQGWPQACTRDGPHQGIVEGIEDRKGKKLRWGLCGIEPGRG
jgi:hypothetical protein